MRGWLLLALLPAAGWAGEGRIEISRADMPFAITNAGSYLLTDNLAGSSGSNGITIAASDVAVDLNGFALTGAAGSLSGIWVSGARSNVTVRNGAVSGWGQHGIDAAAALNGLFADLQLANNGGCGLRAGLNATVRDAKALDNGQQGLDVDSGGVIVNCTARENTENGILARGDCTIRDASVRLNTGHGLLASNNCSIAGVTARENTGCGIVAGAGALVRDGVAYLNGQDGIRLDGAGSQVSACNAYWNSDNGVAANGSGSLVRDCAANRNLDDGIRATNLCVVIANTSISNAVGIRLLGRWSRLENNHAAGNVTGVVVVASNNVLVCNTATANSSSNYSVAANNHFLEHVNPGTNFPANPWVNFRY